MTTTTETEARIEREDLAGIIAREIVGIQQRMTRTGILPHIRRATLVAIYDLVEKRTDRETLFGGKLRAEAKGEEKAASKRAMKAFKNAGPQGERAWRRFVTMVVEEARIADPTVLFDENVIKLVGGAK